MISAMVMSFAHKHWPKKPPKVIVHKDQALINRFIPKFSLQLLEIFLNELCRTWPEMMQLKIEICSTPFQPRNFSWAVNNSQIKSQVCCHQCSHWSHSNHSDLPLCCQDLSWLGKSNPSKASSWWNYWGRPVEGQPVVTLLSRLQRMEQLSTFSPQNAQNFVFWGCKSFFCVCLPPFLQAGKMCWHPPQRTGIYAKNPPEIQ